MIESVAAIQKEFTVELVIAGNEKGSGTRTASEIGFMRCGNVCKLCLRAGCDQSVLREHALLTIRKSCNSPRVNIRPSIVYAS